MSLATDPTLKLYLTNEKGNSILNSLPEEQREDLISFIHKLEKKAGKNQAYFLEYLFYKTHRKYLKDYNKHSSLQELFLNGEYDCVSGSMLYASLLNHFNIDYSIIETDYHVFLIAKVNDHEYIFEATDPLYGFIKDKEEITAYKLKYQPKFGSLGLSSAIEIGSNTYINSEENTIYNKIDFNQLSGLQYYNKGIEALNSQDYKDALSNLLKAHTFYPSERISAILEICKSLSK